MKSAKIQLSQLQSRTFDHNKLANKRFSGNLFGDRGLTYLNEYGFYLTYFNVIPNFIQQTGVQCRKANEWFVKTYREDIKDFYYDKLCKKDGDDPTYDDLFYVMYEDLVVNFDTHQSTVRFFFRKTEVARIEDIRSKIKKFRQSKIGIPKLWLLVKGFHTIDVKSFEITKPKLNLDDNYNDDFKEVHESILKRLSKKSEKGLVLLHGQPGTGKTSYIRYLISSVKKDVIFLPPNMASAITHPDLLPVLIANPNSIFIIEDAENIVIDRETNGVSPVSAILNIADGLLSDCLHIQIICSFNTDISKVDNALLRKGRLIAKYEFKELTIDKANSLSRKLGYSKSFCEPMTLAAVYNQNDQDYQEKRPKFTIGFKALQAN
jgi:hypothetical protein